MFPRYGNESRNASMPYHYNLELAALAAGGYNNVKGARGHWSGPCAAHSISIPPLALLACAANENPCSPPRESPFGYLLVVAKAKLRAPDIR
jgi:hypothetical protein